MKIRRSAVWAVSVFCMGCAEAPLAGPLCLPESGVVSLPASLSESSGVAVSLQNAGVYWTHNDTGRGLFAIDASGAIVAEFTLDVSLTDWEDIAVQTCDGGGSCLYLADVGDNYERRAAGQIRILRLPEPVIGSTSSRDTLATRIFPLALPGGAHDIEALAVLPGERLYLVSKGRNEPVTVYRYPGPLQADTTVLLEQVQLLSDRPRFLSRQISGAAVDPETHVVAVRSYGAIQFFRMDGDSLAHLPAGDVSLMEVQQGQGEGVGFGLGGLVALTAEAGPGGGDGNLMFLRCSIGDLLIGPDER